MMDKRSQELKEYDDRLYVKASKEVETPKIQFTSSVSESKLLI